MFNLSLSSKELFHSNMLAWIAEDGDTRDLFVNILELFGLEDNKACELADGIRDVVLDLPTPITAGANQRVGVRTAISENAWYYQSSGGKGFLYAINVKPNVGDTVDTAFSNGAHFPFALIP